MKTRLEEPLHLMRRSKTHKRTQKEGRAQQDKVKR
jgi:hypothetical protein